MSERSARVVIIEDDVNTLKLIKCVLSRGPHVFIEDFCWVASAMNAVGDLVTEADIVTLDQDIHGGDVVKAGFVREMRRRAPSVGIIGLSCCPFIPIYDGDYVNYDLMKHRTSELNEIIDLVLSL